MSVEETRQALLDKEKNELDMAHKLLEVFDNSDVLMTPLRTTCESCLEDIIRLWDLGQPNGGDTAKNPVARIVGKETYLNVFKARENNGLSSGGPDVGLPADTDMSTTEGLNKVYTRLKNLVDNKDKLGAANCSDVIRLFGGVVEELDGQNPKDNIGQPFKKQWLLQPDLTDDNRLTIKDWNNLRESYRTPWADTEAFDPKVRRLRVKATRRIQDSIEEMLKAWEGIPVDERVNAKLRGVSLNTLLPGSTVRAMDRMFGLPEGADISGTTADNLFAFETVMNATKMLKKDQQQPAVLNLLPIAAMVSQYHHTVLECALTLTMNGVINYQIGFYKTLYPAVSVNLENDELKEVKQNVYNVLASAEDDKRNRHMLVYQTREGDMQAWHMKTEPEISSYRSLVKVNEDLYKRFDRPVEVAKRPLRELASLKDADVQPFVDEIWVHNT
jgi:hypothetical protein